MDRFIALNGKIINLNGVKEIRKASFSVKDNQIIFDYSNQNYVHIEYERNTEKQNKDFNNLMQILIDKKDNL